MRTHHLIAVVAVVLIGFGAKTVLAPANTAQATEAPRFDVSRMHENKVLPQQAMTDMTFVTDSH